MFATTRPLALAVILALVPGLGLVGCNKTKVTEVAAPQANLPLRYDLTPGQVYGGQIKVRNQLETPLGPVTMRFEFDAEMMATGSRSEEGTLIKATANNIQVRIILPDMMPAGAIPVNQSTAEQLNGVEIRFRVDDRGNISDEPDLEGQPPHVQIVLGQIIQGILSGIVRLPEQAIEKGGTWDASPPKKDGLISGSGSGTFASLVRIDGVDEDLAQLQITSQAEREQTAQGQTIKSKNSQEAVVFFAATGGYVAKVDRKYQGTGGGGSLSGESEATWKKLEKREVEITPDVAVQEITDPCDADYVGGEECPDETQAITDPCDADYVGAEACPDAEPPKTADPAAAEPTKASK